MCGSSGEDFYQTFLASMERQLIRTVWRIVRNPELVQDTVQDALTTIWRCREKVRLHPNPQALMLKMAMDVSYDALRRTLRRQRCECPDESAEAVIAPADSSDFSGEIGRLQGAVRRAVAYLPKNQAVAVWMRLVQEQPYGVVAQALGCSEPTARIHVMRGRARLRKLIRTIGRKETESCTKKK